MLWLLVQARERRQLRHQEPVAGLPGVLSGVCGGRQSEHGRHALLTGRRRGLLLWRHRDEWLPRAQVCLPAALLLLLSPSMLSPPRHPVLSLAPFTSVVTSAAAYLAIIVGQQVPGRPEVLPHRHKKQCLHACGNKPEAKPNSILQMSPPLADHGQSSVLWQGLPQFIRVVLTGGAGVRFCAGAWSST